MTAESGKETSVAPPTEDDGSLRSAIATLAARVRAAGAGAADKTASDLARLKTEAAAHPLETVTGAFGVGYLLGKALFGRNR